MSLNWKGNVAMTVTFLSDHDMEIRMSAILSELGMSEVELETNARAYLLDPAQRDLYREFHILASLSED